MRISIRNLVLALLGVVMLTSTLAVYWGLPMGRSREVLDYSEVSDDGMRLYTSRRYLKDLQPFVSDANNDFAEITVCAGPSERETEVLLSTAALETLREIFGEDFEYQRHNVWSAVMFQINVANVKGAYPHVGASSFKAEVTRVRVSRNAGRELSGTLLTVAGMSAIGSFLEDWEKEQQSLAD